MTDNDPLSALFLFPHDVQAPRTIRHLPRRLIYQALLRIHLTTFDF